MNEMHVEPAQDAPQRWSLRTDVAIGSPQDSMLILAGGRFERALKLSGASSELARLLETPVTTAQLAEHLAARYPRHPAGQRHAAVGAFLQRLDRAGLLEAPATAVAGPAAAESASPPMLARWRLPNPDAAARRVADALGKAPAALGSAARAGLVAAVLLCLIGIARLHPIDHASRLDAASGAGIGALLLLWLAGHEFAHAVACRLHGFPVAGAGLKFRGFLLPSAYVNTSAIALGDRRDVQCAVALAGPRFDLGFAACCLAVALAAPHGGAVSLIAEYGAVVTLVALFFNLTPFRASDASSAFSALFSEGGAPDGWPRARAGDWPHASLFHGLYGSAYALLTFRLLTQLIDSLTS
ncbi:PqqD family peptide modification chaperone [Burkholderia sp. 22PA0106]|uniref:PqqD family peptide modification chaperone n=1 Tax=Burkholderia sp. 22PA0106 TaxID=3237371 RepID=UPI0039C1F35C